MPVYWENILLHVDGRLSLFMPSKQNRSQFEPKANFNVIPTTEQMIQPNSLNGPLATRST